MQQILLGAFDPTTAVFLTNTTRNALRVLPDPAAALAQLGLAADGFVKNASNGSPLSNNYQWLLSGIASAYDVRYILLSGTTPAGMTSGLWVNMATDQILSLSRTGGSVGTTTASIQVDLSLAGVASSIATATFTMNATVSP